MKKILFKVSVAVAYLFSMTAAFEFLNNFGAFVNFPAGVLIALLLGICYCAVFAISGSVAASVISVNIVWETLYVVNFYRLRMTSIPFRPADLAMVSKAGQLTAFYKITIEPEAVISVLAVAALTVLFIKIFGKLYTSLRSRMICMNSVLVVFTVVFLSGSYTKVLGNPLSLPIADRYLQNGAMLGFLMSARSEDKPTEIIYGGSEHVVSKPKTSIEKNNTVVTPPPDNSSPTDPPVAEPLPPILISDRSVKKAVQPEVTFPGTLDEEGIIEEIKIPDISSVGEEITLDENTSYTKELMDSIAAYVKNNIIAPKASSNIRPNIIVIQSEAFTDPTLWENVYFSEDPISTVHKLQKNFYSGNIITPSFGGGTCDPEYEMLTGNSFQFITRGDMPFTNPEVYANSPDPRSFPNILKQNGYSTVGIHTYGGSMIFDRKAIYPLLGFDKFIAEEDMTPPESAYKANEYNNVKFLSDEYFTDQIINVFDETEQPLFLFGISMENHFDYFREKFDVYNVVAESKFL
ncbi:MAG: LTA synthase family protein, partial [Clostridiales bacterium]|nr:LTA synthase family protein [Clostridiales bacterium]